MENALWDELCARSGAPLTPAQHALLHRYLDLLFEANEKMNLTRITDRAAAEVQHIGDSLTVLPFLPPGHHLLADVGSGGGVPGIPIAIARPDVVVTLIESTRKKAAFLQATAAKLDLKNVKVIESRAEDVGQSNRRESYDVVLARAVATLDWLAEWCLPLAKKKGGKMLALKGQRVVEELPQAATAIKMMGGKEPIVHPIELPGTDHRVIVEIVKDRKSDTRYPRAATQAKGRPIK